MPTADATKTVPSPTPMETPQEPERSDPILAAEALGRKDTTQLEVIKRLGQVFVWRFYHWKDLPYIQYQYIFLDGTWIHDPHLKIQDPHIKELLDQLWSTYIGLNL